MTTTTEDTTKSYDPEESRQDGAARRVDAASERFAERCDLFVRTLRSNGRDLTPHKRALTSQWLKRHCERLHRTLDETEGVPPLGLDGLLDYDD
jgi:hypothetical protein